MKLLIVSAFCFCLVPLCGAQTAHGTPIADIKPKQDVLPETTLEFEPVGDGLPMPTAMVWVNHPVCSGNGTYYLNAELLPNGERQIIAVSPKDKGEVRTYSMASVPGLLNVQPRLMDANGSDLYVLAEAAKSEDLLNDDVNPGSKEVWRHMKTFILHFQGDPSAPDVIPLDVPFLPEQFAATSDGKFVFLGLERTNRTPVLAVVDGSGELEHYIDAYQDFGTNDAMVANAPQRMKSQLKKMPESALVDFTLVAAQFVHYRSSLLLLMPGTKPKVFTIGSGGSLESTALHLPAGLEAESLIPSNSSWLIRATDGVTNGKELIVMVDPSDGKALRIIRSPKMNINEISCVHDGDYYGIRWPHGEKAKEKVFLMKAAE